MKHKLLFKLITCLVVFTLPLIAGTISGNVQNYDGDPIENATVYITTADSSYSFSETTTTDNNGYFSFENLGAAIFYLTAATSNGDKGSTTPVELADGETVNDVLIKIYESPAGTASISGKVIDTEENAIGNASICAALAAEDSAGIVTDSSAVKKYQTTTDSEGKFLLEEMAAGTYNITAEYYNGTSEFSTTIMQELGDGENAEDVYITIDITEPEWASISGTVKLEDGTALDAIEVHANPVDESFSVDSAAVTDSEGNFSLNRLEPGSYKLSFQISSTITIDREDTYTLAANEEIENLEIVISESEFSYGDLCGKVVTESGKSLKDVQILLMSDNYFGYTNTDDDGNYSFEELVPDAYTIQANHSIGGYIKLENTVTVKGNETVTVEDIVYADEDVISGTVTGTVTYESGSPLANAYIEFKNDEANYKYGYTKTDEDGKFEASLKPGKYYVNCISNDNQYNSVQYYPNVYSINDAEKITVIANQTVKNIDFEFAKPETIETLVISGTVTDEAGNAIQNAEISYNYTSLTVADSSNNENDPILTDEDGNYELTFKNIQTLTSSILVSASAKGYISEYWNDKQEYYLAEKIIPESSEPIEDINFDLQALPSVTGKVFSGKLTDEEGQPIKGAKVIGFHTTVNITTNTRTDESGYYEIPELLEGEYVLLFSANNYIPEYYDDVVDWENSTKLSSTEDRTNIDAVLSEIVIPDSAAFQVVGTVSDEDETLIAGVYVTATNEENEIIGYDFTDENGTYTIEGSNYENLKVSASKVKYDVAEDEVNCTNEMIKTHIQNLVIKKTTSSTAIEDDSEEVTASKIALHGNYPNPFNPTTNIAYEINKSASVRLEIYSLLGTRVATLVNKNQSAGRYIVVWNAESNEGKKLNSGIYFTRLVVNVDGGESFAQTKRMVLMK